MTKNQKCYFLLALLETIGITLVQMLYGLLDILMAIVSFLLDAETLKNKLYAILIILCTLPVIFLDGDATATVIISMIAVPMFFAKKSWIL